MLKTFLRIAIVVVFSIPALVHAEDKLYFSYLPKAGDKSAKPNVLSVEGRDPFYEPVHLFWNDQATRLGQGVQFIEVPPNSPDTAALKKAAEDLFYFGSNEGESIVIAPDGEVIVFGAADHPISYNIPDLARPKVEAGQRPPRQRFIVRRPLSANGGKNLIMIFHLEMGVQKQGIVIDGGHVYKTAIEMNSFPAMMVAENNGTFELRDSSNILLSALTPVDARVTPTTSRPVTAEEATFQAEALSRVQFPAYNQAQGLVTGFEEPQVYARPLHIAHVAPVMPVAAKVENPTFNPLDDSRFDSIKIGNGSENPVSLRQMLEKMTFNVPTQGIEKEEVEFFNEDLQAALTGLNMRKGGGVRVTGKPGTGKTHFSEVLGAYIKSQGAGSERLQGHILLAFSASSIAAGTALTGTIETRVEALKKAAAIAPLILFVDEMHTLVGTGTHQGNSNDVLQMLKTELASGQIKIVGTTTAAEWERFFSKDQALVDRFPVNVVIQEPTTEKILAIAERFIRRSYADSKTQISHDEIASLIALAKRYDPIGANPRKTLRLLDYVLSAAEVKGLAKIDDALVVDSASKLYGYDIGALSPERISQNIIKLEAGLAKEIAGNDPAKQELIMAINDHLLHQPHTESTKPFSALLYGKKGVGKTKLATSISNGLGYGFRKISMNSYGSPADVDLFKTTLAMAIRQNPYQTVLLDEIEKAHPWVQQTLLQILDDGFFEANISDRPQELRLTEVDASKAFFIVTTNAGENLANVPHSRAQFARAAEADGLNRFVLDRIPNQIAMPNPDEAMIHAILDMKWQEIETLFKKSNREIQVDRALIVEQVLATVSKATTGPSIGFVDKSDNEKQEISIREIERELLSIRQKLSWYFRQNASAEKATISFRDGQWAAGDVTDCGELLKRRFAAAAN